MQTPRLSFTHSIILLLFATLLFPTVSLPQVQPVVASTFRGDITEDGKVDIFDLLEMLKLLRSEPQSERERQIANVDKSADGKVNIFDLLAMLKLLSGEEPEEIYWGPAIAGLSRLSAAVGDTIGLALINFDVSITADQCKAYVTNLEAEITAFSLDTISIVIPEGFTGGDVSLIVATDTTNSKYLNLQIKQSIQAADGGVVVHPEGPGVDVPAGALAADAAITVELPTKSQLTAMNLPADTGATIVLFGPSETGLTGPVTVALPWPHSATEADSLGAQYYDESTDAWKAVRIAGSDSERRLVYVLTDCLSAFKAVKTLTVQVRFLTTSRWATFRLVSGGAMSLHHVITLSENAVAAVVAGDSILLSQPTEQKEAGNINPWTQERVEMVVDLSFNVPDLSGELVFNINQSSDEGAWTHVAVANYLGAEPNNREDFWWAGHKDLHPWPHTKTVRISAAELFSQSPARVPVAVDPTTLDKKILFGYQGWYLCPEDGSDLNRWQGWGQEPISEKFSSDHWPDMSELSPEERFATDLTLPDGRPAELFSSYLRKTVDRHFEWMEDYDLDGIFIGRDPEWPTELTHSWFCKKNKVLQNIRAAAEAHGRVFAIEKGWDLSFHSLEDWKRDWMFMVDVLKITESPNYLYHKGKPLLVIQGVDEGNNTVDLASVDSLVKWLKEEADPKYQATVQSGNHLGWHTVDEDTKTNWYLLYRSFDVLQPWFERHAYEQADCYRDNLFLPGLAEASAAGVDYMPVIFPGFSVYNRNEQLYDYKYNMIPRLGGKYIWRQAYDAISSGANMLYIAMFDELNEGTPMLKLATNADLPVGLRLVTLDMDGYAVPGDWYLQVVREIGRMMRGEIPLSPEMPLALPAYDPNLDTAVRPDIDMVSIPGGSFAMGSATADDSAGPVHTVTVSPFQMSQYEITNAQYAAFLNQVLEEDEMPWITPAMAGVDGTFLCDQGLMYTDFTSSYDSDNRCWISFDGSSFSVAPGKEDWPVVYVTWYGAKSFARRYGFDLPTEAEWEYACRGGLQYEYGTDNGTLSSAKANYGASLGHPANVGSYPANPFGLYDMSGNVSEWCKDWYGSYSSGSQSDPQGPDTGTSRVRRGGNWLDEANYCRSAFRSSGDPGTTAYGYNTGFRVVKRPE
ncbi:MAG TPA: SUMF1/EgtB/PvdO family nonheme iron enzyme [archaeon]|nr:SUMF1/EgtB/PvdO family nonheme iron enzyme [archaeon]